MEYCPECGTEARTDVTYCPGCGTDLTEYRQWSPAADAAPDDASSQGANADAEGPPDATDRSDAAGTAEEAGSGADAADSDPEGTVDDGGATGTLDDADDGANQQRSPDATPPGDGPGSDDSPASPRDDDRPANDRPADSQPTGHGEPQADPEEPQPGPGEPPGGQQPDPDHGRGPDPERSRDAGPDRGRGQPSDRTGRDGQSQPRDRDPQGTEPRGRNQQPGRGQPPGGRQGGRTNEGQAPPGGRQQQGRGGQPAPNPRGGQPAGGQGRPNQPPGGQGRANQPQGGPQGRDPQPAGGPAGGGGGNQWQGDAAGGAAQGRGPAVDRTPSFTDRLTALPFARSLGVGAALYVVTYAVTYLAFLADVLVLNASKHELSASNLMPLSPVENATASMWQFVGWLFYEGQMVTIERTRVVEAGGQQESTTEAISFFEASYWTQFQGISDIIVTSALYTAVPVLVLIAGSALFVKYQRGGDDDSPSGMLLGASVVVGYAVLGAAGSLLFSATHTEFESAATAELSTTPVLMEAVMFPAAFALVAGAIGGIVADSVGGDDAPAAQPPQ